MKSEIKWLLLIITNIKTFVIIEGQILIKNTRDISKLLQL